MRCDTEKISEDRGDGFAYKYLESMPSGKKRYTNPMTTKSENNKPKMGDIVTVKGDQYVVREIAENGYEAIKLSFGEMPPCDMFLDGFTAVKSGEENYKFTLIKT